ncbi:uncharacterized protein NKAPD1 isoform X1 [Poecilia latipinna]|nr:PREDICTED: uncharacterized protein C11orf57 homolog isoform X1 [Poecilia latipinna]
MDVGLSSGVAMAKQPLGKTLLRNVIRHTDAHNKIQEEMEMWKMRDWEIQASDHKHLPNADIMRGGMHCDRVSDHPRNMSAGRERASEHDDREARYWTRRLYEFEAGDPDRWGHSGFKELYPEEFDTDSDKSVTIKNRRHKMKKSKSDTEACLSKRSKKSSRRKKKKKKKADSSSDNSDTDDRSDTKDKQRKKKRGKGRHKNKKSVKTQRRDEDSSSEESNSGGKKERQTNSRKKRKRDSLKDSDSELDSKKKRRKNWKEAGEENSNDSE